MLRLVLLPQNERIRRKLLVLHSFGQFHQKRPLDVVKQWQMIEKVCDAVDLVVSQVFDNGQVGLLVQCNQFTISLRNRGH